MDYEHRIEQVNVVLQAINTMPHIGNLMIGKNNEN
jgi:hypothetical protein